MATAKVITTIVKAATKKPSVMKAVGKFVGRYVLRRTGVFGIYGSFKRFLAQGLTKDALLKAVTKSVLKKNILRMLGPTNYFIDIFKKGGGVKYALKQFAWQRMTPMCIKKIWYLKQNFDRTYGAKNPILQESKKEIWEHLDKSNKNNTYLWKLERIEEILNTKEMPKKYREELVNNWFYFRVNSTSGNFNRKYYKWHPVTGELIANVRSGSGGASKDYTAYGVPLWLIKKSIKTSRYGKMVYWVWYHPHKNY